MVRFGDQACACRVDTLQAIREQTRRPSTKVSWLFDELSDNNASDDGLLSASVAVNKQISKVIPTPGNNAIFVVYQINACYNIYARDGALRFVKSTPINNSLKEAV